MSNVKKVYQPLIELLEANANKNVKTLMPQILEMVQSKQLDKTFKRDEEGKVTHVFCYYHKEWESVDECDYSPRPKSASGLNNMCKIGTNQWNKQNRDFKKAKEGLLDKLMNGLLAQSELEDAMAEAELAQKVIIPLDSQE